MIESILEMITALANNVASIIFTNDDIRTRSADCCGWLRHRDGTPIFKILQGGLYEVSFNANVTSATAGTVALGLFQDGVLVPGTTVIAEVVTPGDYYNVSFDKLLKLCCGEDASLSVGAVPSVFTGAVAPGTAVETEIPVIQNANFSIIKKA